jgi:hypothetical protein
MEAHNFGRVRPPNTSQARAPAPCLPVPQDQLGRKRLNFASSITQARAYFSDDSSKLTTLAKKAHATPSTFKRLNQKNLDYAHQLARATGKAITGIFDLHLQIIMAYDKVHPSQVVNLVQDQYDPYVVLQYRVVILGDCKSAIDHTLAYLEPAIDLVTCVKDDLASYLQRD